MRRLALLLPALFTASLVFSSAMALEPPAHLGPGPGTVQAVQCLLRQGPRGCERMFVGRAWLAARPWVFQNSDRDFKRGPLVSSSFWGPASASNVFDAKILVTQSTPDMDIFDVKFAHVEYTFYVSHADQDEKIRGLAVRLYAPHDPLQIRSRLGG